MFMSKQVPRSEDDELVEVKRSDLERIMNLLSKLQGQSKHD